MAPGDRGHSRAAYRGHRDLPREGQSPAFGGSIAGMSGQGNPVAIGDALYIDVCVGRSVTLAKGSYAEF